MPASSPPDSGRRRPRVGPRWLPPPAFWCGRVGEGRRVTWIELFFDLVFVAAVAQVGAPLAADYSFHGLGRYAFLLTLIWWAWSGYATYATRFDPDDGLQRGLTLAQMVAVLFMAANAEDDLGSVSSAGFAAAYAAMRLMLVIQYLRALHIPAARRLASEFALGFGVAAVLWLASSLAPVPWRYGLWIAALAIDVATSLAGSRHTERLPPDASHLPERFGLFTLILLGESIVAIMRGVQAQPDWSLAAASSALLGMAFVFALWWWYFDGATAASERIVRDARDARRLDVWAYAHLPLYLGLAMAGVGIESVVRTGARGPLAPEAAWILCSAAATVMAALTLLEGVTVQAVPRARSWGVAAAAAPLLLAAASARLPAAIVVALLAVVAVSRAAVVARRAPRLEAEGAVAPEGREPDRRESPAYL
jgi:low temperature requirement protein LtrA